MTEIRNSRLLILCLIFFTVALFQPSAIAQINNYERLSFRYNNPNIYLTTFTLPGQVNDEVQLVAAFRINYRFLSFKKADVPGSEQFYATPSLNIQIFKSPDENLSFREQVDIVDLESVARVSWSDTVYADDYEATEQISNYTTGFMQVQLPPGYYTYIIQFGQNKGANKRSSSTRNIHIGSYESHEEVILASEVDNSGGMKRLNLVNLGSNVLFGDDFYVFIHLPDYETGSNYTVQVHRIRTSQEDTARVETVFEETISDEQIITAIRPEPAAVSDQLFLELRQNENGHTYALVQIPNSAFPDDEYKIELIDESSEAVAQKVYRSLWLDKPVSLYNIDIAIEMLRFIASEQTVEKISDGSAAAEREKFNAFWEERDPTPHTVYNELKAEFYGRIDYAYEHFSSGNTPGFETDRGRIYILYGEPQNIERVFPGEGATREIWTYENRKFIFRATTGFGDFELVQ